MTALIFAGHSVVGKLAVGEIGPMTLTFLRWSLACGPIWFAARRNIGADFPVLRRRWLYVASVGALGYTSFNALFYLSAHYTSALNMSLIQSCIPALVLIGAGLGFGARPTLPQSLGAAATIAGVATIAAQGDFARIATLGFNFGDALLLIACLFYAYYTLALRYRPAVSSIGFLAGHGAGGVHHFDSAVSHGKFGGKVWRGRAPKASQCCSTPRWGRRSSRKCCIMRGVELIGPGRAGVFVNLVPIFGAFLAVGLLGEPLAAYHLVAMALVVGGIVLAQRGRGRRHENRETGRAPRCARGEVCRTTLREGVMGEWIDLKAADGFDLKAWRAAPRGAPKGGVVVIQEIFGVNHHIRSVTDRLAAAGYLAIAPAVFDRVERGVELGYDQPGMAKGMELAGKMDREKALADIAAAIAAASAGGKVGITGFCMGGTYAWARRGAAFGSVGGGRLLRRRHRRPQGFEAESSDDAAFRREGRPHPHRRRERGRGSCTPTCRFISTPPATASTATSGRATTSRAPTLAWERTLAFFAEHVG